MTIAIVILTFSVPTLAAEGVDSSDKVRLKWGARSSPGQFKTARAGEPARDESSQLQWESNRSRRAWRFRIILPQFSAMFADGGSYLGTEQGFELEIADRHVVTLGMVWGADFLMGGGAGYAYEMELVQRIVRLQLGGTVGFYGFDASYSDSTNFAMLRPTLHVGYKWFFFSLGPRLGIGPDVSAGVALGFTLRL